MSKADIGLIGPDIQSGIRAAEAIIHRTKFSLRSIPRYSILDLVFPGRSRKPGEQVLGTKHARGW